MEVVGGKAVYNGRPLADWVPEVIQRVFERTDALRVVVFGSVRRGDDGPDSDIDLLVVLPESLDVTTMRFEFCASSGICQFLSR
jgi:predicted nucleotidyltransferase